MERRHWIILAASVTLLAVGAALGMMSWIVITGGGDIANEPTRVPTLDVLATPTLSNAEITQLMDTNSTLQAQLNTLQATLDAVQAALPESSPEPTRQAGSG